jgi:hypothetical protein
MAIIPITVFAQSEWGNTCNNQDSLTASCKDIGGLWNYTCAGMCHTVIYSPSCGICGASEGWYCWVVLSYTSTPYIQDSGCVNLGLITRCGCPSAMPTGTYGAPVTCNCNP